MLYTHKELNTEVKSIVPPLKYNSGDTTKPVPAINTKSWILMNPDMRINSGKSFKTTLNIDGKDYPYECKNGKVVTNEELLKNRLIKHGYILIEEVNDVGNSYRQ